MLYNYYDDFDLRIICRNYKKLIISFYFIMNNQPNAIATLPIFQIFKQDFSKIVLEKWKKIFKPKMFKIKFYIKYIIVFSLVWNLAKP